MSIGVNVPFTVDNTYEENVTQRCAICSGANNMVERKLRCYQHQCNTTWIQILGLPQQTIIVLWSHGNLSPTVTKINLVKRSPNTTCWIYEPTCLHSNYMIEKIGLRWMNDCERNRWRIKDKVVNQSVPFYINKISYVGVSKQRVTPF
jgi:hypothetical protein